ncbi:MAG: hypothetical protein QXR17_09090 [Candidatus Bathyarchaeia archaeon]
MWGSRRFDAGFLGDMVKACGADSVIYAMGNRIGATMERFGRRSC